MKNLAKITLVLLILVLVGSIWLGAHWLGKVKRLSNRVEADATVLREHLDDTRPAVGDARPPEFERGEFLGLIQQEWSRSTGAREYPTSILRPAPRRTPP